MFYCTNLCTKVTYTCIYNWQFSLTPRKSTILLELVILDSRALHSCTAPALQHTPHRTGIALAGHHQGTVGHWLRTTLLVPAPLFRAQVRCVLCQTPPFICSAHHDWPRPESPPFSQRCAHCNGRYNFMLNPCIPCLPGVATHFTASLRDIMVSLCVLLCGAVFPPVVRILENTEWRNLPRNVPRNFFQKLKKWFQMV
mgnify:FL=1